MPLEALLLVAVVGVIAVASVVSGFVESMAPREVDFRIQTSKHVHAFGDTVEGEVVATFRIAGHCEHASISLMHVTLGKRGRVRKAVAEAEVTVPVGQAIAAHDVLHVPFSLKTPPDTSMLGFAGDKFVEMLGLSRPTERQIFVKLRVDGRAIAPMAGTFIDIR
jgi:hypothetical protein